MFPKEIYNALKEAKKQKEYITIKIDKNKPFKGIIYELTPWYINIRFAENKEKQKKE